MSDEICDRNERRWWDLWNTSYRTNDNNDAVSSELFERAAAVINEITRTKCCRVLEVGCGAGTLSRLLNYSSYHGLDLSPAAIEIARKKGEGIARPSGSSVPTYEVADFHNFPLQPEVFDVAICVDAVAYFYDQQFALKKMAQSLVASGTLVLTTINPFVYHRIRRTSSSSLREGSVSRWLSRRELHKLVISAGFTIERSYTIMPRGNIGILRLINARRVNEAFGPRSASAVRSLKEGMGLGQYRLVVARKKG